VAADRIAPVQRPRLVARRGAAHPRRALRLRLRQGVRHARGERRPVRRAGGGRGRGAAGAGGRARLRRQRAVVRA
jgi:hypothetical protein